MNFKSIITTIFLSVTLLNLCSAQSPFSLEDLNPNSMEVIEALIEASVSDAEVGDRFQFERNGYFILDADSDKGKIFNRIIIHFKL